MTDIRVLVARHFDDDAVVFPAALSAALRIIGEDNDCLEELKYTLNINAKEFSVIFQRASAAHSRTAAASSNILFMAAAIAAGKEACGDCGGCGQVADSDDREPWTAWLDLPPGSDLAVRTGLVKPVPCQQCAGTGHLEKKP